MRRKGREGERRREEMGRRIRDWAVLKLFSTDIYWGYLGP